MTEIEDFEAIKAVLQYARFYKEKLAVKDIAGREQVQQNIDKAAKIIASMIAKNMARNIDGK